MKCALNSLASALVLALLVSPRDHIRAANNAGTLPLPADYLSPAALLGGADGQRLYVGLASANCVGVFSVAQRQMIRLIDVGSNPVGLALSSDEKTLYVTCAAVESSVCIIDTAGGKANDTIAAGHTALAPVLSPDGKSLFVACRFDNAVDVIDLTSKKRIRRIPVAREPVAAAITSDGKYLLVANHLHAGRADADIVAAKVSVIDIAAGKVCKEIELPNGSTLLRDIRISPDGRYACVTHQIGRFHLPTTQLERGWVNTSALSLIDLSQLALINSVLLDNIDRGAANPWAAAWAADGKILCVTHAGTHELSVIDFPGLLAKLSTLPAKLDPGASVDYTVASRVAADVPNDLSFLVGLRQRIELSEGDRGPRALALLGHRAWLANYFSDSLAMIDLAAARPSAESVALCRPNDRIEKSSPPSQAVGRSHVLGALDANRNASAPRSAGAFQTGQAALIRRGEMLFNDASICFQGWQSCASCHSSDARVDGLNWDNLNDGIGNPKNVKSLLLSHQTPPSMALGVRANAYLSVRAGIKNSLFTVQPEEDATAIDEYLKSLQPIPSPHLIKGKPSPAAERGKKVFYDKKVGCADCHKGKFYTDLKLHNVGTMGRLDHPTNRFDTPTLIEVWRSAPYLHDGRAATLREIWTGFNEDDQHGVTSHLTPRQIEDLVQFVLSL